MMSDMHSPKQSDFMIEAMQPVIKEILQYQEHDPIHDDIGERKNLELEEPCQHQQVSTANKNVEKGIQHHKVDISSSVLPGISLFMTVIA
jgi:hypothetical protein